MKVDNMNIQNQLLDIVVSIPQKIYEVLSNLWTALGAVIIFCGVFLGERLPLLAYIGVAVLVDCIWGVATAKKVGRFIVSKLIMRSALKIAAYVSIYGLVALIEKGFTDESFIISSSIVAAILIISELWSVLGHIAIAYPDFVVVRLLKRYLRGEIAKKLGIPEEEVDDILNNNKQKKDDTEQKDSSNT